MILIGCGAAAAISAIFKAPIAGLVFSVELFAVNAAGSSIIALLISSAVACLFSMVVSGYQVEFRFTVHNHFSPANVPYYVVLGAVMAFVSVYFMRSARAMDSLVKRIPAGLARIAAGGLAVGALIFVFPPLYGEGYYAMRSMLTDKMAELFSNSIFLGLSGHSFFLPILLIVLALVKPLATALTTSSGGVGGTFAPTLFVGCVMGYAFAALINLTGIAHLPEMNFALAGMAGAISGVMHAPLTGIFLIAELTGGYELFIPLIIVSCLSTVITRQFEPYSIYTRPLAMRGKLITHHKDKAVLTLLQIKDFVELDRPILWADTSMEELTHAITSNPCDYYPVEERNGKFLGFIDMKDVLPVLVNPELRDYFLFSDLFHNPRRYLDVSMGMDEILGEFKESNELELPVFENGALLGFVSRARLYAAYRDKLEEISDGDET
jgi:CIC family chloride channel protein